MDSEDEEDDPKPEKLPIYRKGIEIFDMVNKIAALIPEDNEYLMEVKSQMLCDAALLSVLSKRLALNMLNIIRW